MINKCKERFMFKAKKIINEPISNSGCDKTIIKNGVYVEGNILRLQGYWCIQKEIKHADNETEYVIYAIAPETIKPVAIKPERGKCPNCGNNAEALSKYKINYCFNCGQRLDWSDYIE